MIISIFNLKLLLFNITIANILNMFNIDNLRAYLLYFNYNLYCFHINNINYN